MGWQLLFWAVVFATSELISGANILVLSPYAVPSHTVNFIGSIVKGLAQKNHSITYWSGLEHRVNVGNIKYLYSEALRPINADHGIYIGMTDGWPLLLTMPHKYETLCSLIYRDRIFDDLMKSSEQFDVILVEAFMNECVLPLVDRFEAPFIYLNSFFPQQWHTHAMGNPLGLSFVPSYGHDFTEEMNLWRRAQNLLSCQMGIIFRNSIGLGTVDKIAAQMLGGKNRKPVAEIERNVSMMITNTHFSLNYRFVKSDDIVEAGGLHCKESRPLPQDFEEFVSDSGEHGFILVSFGSVLAGSSMNDATRNLLTRTFARLKQKVIWKWENPDRFTSVPNNTKLAKWVPQQDLLGHPKMRLFITHGGLCSMQESVFHAVPMIGLPVFCDQAPNMNKAQNDGYAIRLHWHTLTEQILYNAIQRVLTEPTFKENVVERSRIFRDAIEPPIQKAVYSIEYVIRHRGAPHLRVNAARQLTTFQRDMVDVFLLAMIVLLLLSYGLFCLFRSIIRLIIAELVSFDYPTKDRQADTNKEKTN